MSYKLMEDEGGYDAKQGYVVNRYFRNSKYRIRCQLMS